MNKKAFTLIELIVVIVIIGIVYAVVLNNFKSEQNITPSNFANLKDKFLPFYKRGDLLEFYVYDDCSKSAIIINNELQDKKVDLNIKAFKDIQVYKTDKFADPKKVEFAPVKIDNRIYDVCFKFSIFPNSSSSSYIVHFWDKYYILYPYMIETKIVSNLKEAVDIFTNQDIKKIVSYETSHDF